MVSAVAPSKDCVKELIDQCQLPMMTMLPTPVSRLKLVKSVKRTKK